MTLEEMARRMFHGPRIHYPPVDPGPFKLGTIIKLRYEYWHQFPRYSHGRQGIVVGYSRDRGRCLWIRWDGNRTSSSMHRTFVEPLMTPLIPKPLPVRT